LEPARFNNLEVRLARREVDLDAAQALRYRVFFDEMGATPSPECRRAARDMDDFDASCDHLLVVDRERGSDSAPCVVGTYRLLRGCVAAARDGFYSEGEFDLTRLHDYPGEIMELGRSCIDAAYRKRGAMQLLWRGIANYIFHHDVAVMFGCGSIHGTDVNEAKHILSYLHHYHTAPKYLRPQAVDERYVDMNLMPKKAVDPDRAMAEAPPLLKGYLRVGGYVGDGAVIDHEFNTIDVCIVVETENVTGKYIRHFGKDKAPSVELTPGLAAE